MSKTKREIYCCQCEVDVIARLTDGKEIYPHRHDLYSIPFWKCDTCGNYTGCHHKTKSPTEPLGVIPTPAIRQLRVKIHTIIDPVWKLGKVSRGRLYSMMTEAVGWKFHTSKIRTLAEAEKCLAASTEIGRTQ